MFKTDKNKGYSFLPAYWRLYDEFYRRRKLHY